MVLFGLTLRPGVPLYEQVVYAAKRAIVTGQLHTGDPFPSVRVLSRELKINPNTGHKVIDQLVSEGILTVRRGIGTVVAEPILATDIQRNLLLQEEIEHLVVDAKLLGLAFDQVQDALALHWEALEVPENRDFRR